MQRGVELLVGRGPLAEPLEDRGEVLARWAERIGGKPGELRVLLANGLLDPLDAILVERVGAKQRVLAQPLIARRLLHPLEQLERLDAVVRIEVHLGREEDAVRLPERDGPDQHGPLGVDQVDGMGPNVAGRVEHAVRRGAAFARPAKLRHHAQGLCGSGTIPRAAPAQGRRQHDQQRQEMEGDGSHGRLSFALNALARQPPANPYSTPAGCKCV